MNNVLNNIPNKIKQPSECCIYCGKSYKLKKNLNKHILLCEIIYKTKTQKRTFIIEEDENEIPSQKQMYDLIIELSIKVNKLEKKLEDMNKWVDKKKKKINVLEWLNNNKNPNINFHEFLNKIDLYELNIDINTLFDNNIFDIINNVISDIMVDFKLKEECPLFASSQKQNTLYFYDTDNSTISKNMWSEIYIKDFTKFINKIHNKIIKKLYNWKQDNIDQFLSSDKISEQYNKTLLKIMNIDLKNESIYNRIKIILYNKLKIDMKSFIEYEFEF